jgi:hypothetical protein
MASVLSAAFLPLLLSAALMLALAGWLLWLDIGKTANRVFAALLTVRALSLIVGPVRAVAGNEATYHFFNDLAPYTALPLVPLTLYFISVFPRRRWLAKTATRRVAFIAVSFGAVAWYMLDHAAWGTAASADPIPFAAAGAGHYYVDYGPLILLSGLRLPVFGLAAFVFARDYVRMPMGAPRYSIFLVYAAFALNALFDGTKFVIDDLVGQAPHLQGYAWLPWGWVFAILPSMTFLPAIASLAVIARHGLRHIDPGPRKVARNFLLVSTAPVLTAVLVSVDADIPVLDSVVLQDFTLGVWRLFVPLLVTYALLRYQLFGIDLRVKAGVRHAVIVSIFTLTFFVVTEAAEKLIVTDQSTSFGVVAAGVLALASRPLEQLAAKAGDRVMPAAQPIARMTESERRRFYRQQYRLVEEDGNVTAKERRILERLRKALDIRVADAKRLEDGTLMLDGADDVAERAAIEARSLDADEEDSGLELLVKGGIVAATIALVFGMLSEGIESLIPLSSFEAGLATAAAIALLLAPIQNGAQRLTDRLFPSVSRPEDRADARRLRLYRDAVEEALADGVLSRRDKTFLGHLREQLGIEKKQGAAIENEIRARLGGRQRGRAA